MSTTLDRSTRTEIVLEKHRREIERIADMGDAPSKVIIESFGQVIADLVGMEVNDGFDVYSYPGLGSPNAATEKGLSLQDVCRVTKYLERQTKINGGLLGRGLRLKSNYLSGRGFTYGKKDGSELKRGIQEIVEAEHNWQAVFSPTAVKELNRVLFTSGNIFIKYDTISETFTRLSIDTHIVNAILSRKDRSRIEYVLVQYSPKTPNGSNPEREWVPTFEHRERLKREKVKLPRTLPTGHQNQDPVVVNQHSVIIEKRVNKDNGDTWGVPDSLAAAPYAVLYARYIKNAAALQETLTSIAYVIEVASKAAGEDAAAQIQQKRVGDAVIGGKDTKVSQVPSAGRVNLYEGRPIAAMVAASLDVSTTGITSDPGLGGSYASESALSQPELLAALSRQEDFIDLFRQIFLAMGAKDSSISFKRLDTDPIHRIVQSLTQVLESDGISYEEYRARSTQLLDVAIEKTGTFFSDRERERLEIVADKAAKNATKSSVGGFDDDGNSARNDDKAASEA